MKAPTPSELEILHFLWQQGEARVQEINHALNQNPNQKRLIGYTTTLKLTQLMHEKKLVGRRKEGKSHIYFPLVEEGETKSSLVSRFVDITFGGSSARLVMQLLGNKKISKAEIKEIRDYLNEIEGEK